MKFEPASMEARHQCVGDVWVDSFPISNHTVPLDEARMENLGPLQLSDPVVVRR